MSAFETILYEKKNGAACVTLNRPKALNAYNIKMRDEMYQVLGAVRDDPDVRVIIFSGAGDKAFCAGADLTEFLTAPSPVIARQVRFERDVWSRFLGIEKPIIAAMHGYVLGDGVEIAGCCDIRIASDDVQFGTPEMGLGIITAAGGSQTVPRIINRSYALDVLITGRWVKAEEALKMKLVNKIVPRDELMPVVEKIADRIKSFDPLAVRCVKQAVTRGLDMTLNQGLELEAALAERLLAS
ncbi:MAG: enoyl-CoA hydratase/isomerase family protein [Dehalococcoidales bacterium]|nr:MAG: enoyl-CoA hydratase/isomerase family protein [Dehalococcoidales bacterium]